MSSIIDYQQSTVIGDMSFAAIIFAAIRKADSKNIIHLQIAFPALYSEFMQRYNAPGGAITEAEKNWLERSLE